MNIAEKACIRHKVPVAVFSMEMSDTQLVMRLFSSLGQIGQDKLRSGKLDNHDWVNLRSAMTMLKGARMFIDQTPSLSPIDLRARARRNEARARYRADRDRLSAVDESARIGREPDPGNQRNFAQPPPSRRLPRS